MQVQNNAKSYSETTYFATRVGNKKSPLHGGRETWNKTSNASQQVVCTCLLNLNRQNRRIESFFRSEVATSLRRLGVESRFGQWNFLWKQRSRNTPGNKTGSTGLFSAMKLQLHCGISVSKIVFNVKVRIWKIWMFLWTLTLIQQWGFPTNPNSHNPKHINTQNTHYF